MRSAYLGLAGDCCYSMGVNSSRAYTILSMEDEQLKAFINAVQLDANLQERVKAAASPQAVVVIAKEAGFVISVEAMHSLSNAKELSDEELADVAGGWRVASGRLDYWWRLR